MRRDGFPDDLKTEILYLKKQLNVPPSAHGKKYSKEQSLHWLRCLAKWMQAEQKVELWIGELQPTMLKDYWRFWLLYGLLVGLAFGLVGWLFKTSVFGATAGLIAWLSFGLLGCLLWKWAGKIGEAIDEAGRPLRLPVSWQDVKAFSAKLAWWLIVPVVIGIVLALVQEGKIVVHGPSLALFVLFAGLLTWPLNETAFTAFAECYSVRHPAVFSVHCFYGYAVFCPIPVLGGTAGNSGRAFFQDAEFLYRLVYSSNPQFFYLGTNQVLQHYLLRLCLRWEGQLPLRLVSWLEAMQQRKVLQRVGGSYHFLHKQLREYLAR